MVSFLFAGYLYGAHLNGFALPIRRKLCLVEPVVVPASPAITSGYCWSIPWRLFWYSGGKLFSMRLWVVVVDVRVVFGLDQYIVCLLFTPVWAQPRWKSSSTRWPVSQGCPKMTGWDNRGTTKNSSSTSLPFPDWNVSFVLPSICIFVVGSASAACCGSLLNPLVVAWVMKLCVAPVSIKAMVGLPLITMGIVGRRPRSVWCPLTEDVPGTLTRPATRFPGVWLPGSHCASGTQGTCGIWGPLWM